MATRSSRGSVAPTVALVIGALVSAFAHDAAAQPAEARRAPPAPQAESTEPAQPKPRDPAIEAAAKARFAEGLKLYGNKKFEQARAAFLQAYLLQKQPAALLALAQATLRSGHHLEAVRYFERYLAENPPPPPKVRTRIDASLVEARTSLASVSVNAPPGAEVFVDDASIGKTPLRSPIDLAPGTHSVKVELGEDSTSHSVSLGPGASEVIELVPKPKPKGPPPPAKLKAPTPVIPSEETSGIFSPPRTTWPMYLAGAVGLVGLSSAVVFGSLSINSNKGAQVGRDALAAGGQSPDRCLQPTANTQYEAACAAISGNARNAAQQQTAFTVSVAVGGAGIGLAALWYLVAPKEQAVVPSAGKEGVGVTFITAF